MSEEIKDESKKRKYNIMTSRTKISNEDCPDFLEGKCKKLFCDKIHNYSKIYRKQNNIEFLNNFSCLQKDFIVLSEYQKKLYENQELDIMFICDCTGSMDPWILAVKKELKNIISYIIENNPFVKIKMSFLGYRDIKDNKRFEIKDFTDDFDSLENFIAGINAEGGGDVPEDITGALDQALKLSWRKKSAKFCILIADAPCHGKKYRKNDDEEKDDYPDGDPNGLNPEFLIGDFGRKDINLFFIKINNNNDVMNEIFNNNYITANKNHSPIIIAELGKKSENLGFIVSVNSNETLNKFTVDNIPLDNVLSAISKERKNMSKILNDTIMNAKNRNKKKKKDSIKMLIEKEVDTQKTYDNFISTNKNEDNAICHSYIIKKDRHMNMNWKNPYINHYKVETKCIIDD